MQATVQITCDGGVVACLDTDDYAEDDEARTLIGLTADHLLDQCARVAIDAFFKLHAQDDGE